MKIFPAGSEWRKWDLHVHLPMDSFSNSFDKKDGEIDWGLFCSVVEESDVDAFGMTDYFQLSGFFEFQKEHEFRYPDSSKLFFPVVEVRLNEAVNGKREDVNFHILFRPDVTQETVDEFLTALKTEVTVTSGKRLSCLELTTKDHFNQATVTREAIAKAYVDTFGKLPQSDNIITFVPSNNDGIRADGTNYRKMNLADQIDKVAHAVFGNTGNSEWFLRKDRFEKGSGESRPKPVFTGSDAHRFEDLRDWLGKEAGKPNQKHITWVKGDLTYEGLQQTLVEPAERVRISRHKPDFKEPYRYIKKIVFEGPDFPEEIEFNTNLTSIIGSRSSGKSALLAYVAHAVDSKHTIGQQLAVAATGAKATDMGPAAGHTWQAVESLERRVIWGNVDAATGQVIYVPQNSLYEISTRPTEITEKIRPALIRIYPELAASFETFSAARDANGSAIADRVTEWFQQVRQNKTKREDLATLGDRVAIAKASDDLTIEIESLRKSSSLSDEEVETYTRVSAEVAASNRAAEELEGEVADLELYVTVNETSGDGESVTVSITTDPPAHAVGANLAAAIGELVEQARARAVVDLKALISQRYSDAKSASVALREESGTILATHADLFRRYTEQSNTGTLEERLNTHITILKKMDAASALITTGIASATAKVDELVVLLKSRTETDTALKDSFTSEPRSLLTMDFGLDFGYSSEELETLALSFNKHAASEYLAPEKQKVDMKAITLDVSGFLAALESGSQKIRQGEDASQLAARVLSSAPEIRLSATLEGDRIGGFSTPTMTPGKQALFALTLILSESDEPWPLLLDQPEDDLDSRSIYEVIVPYLIAAKRDRQIIMVSHNANLVVGADSESVIVANRHGHDRKNCGGRLFDYKSGSLEHSQELNEKVPTLESLGISEHACEILDGGTDAFEKRKNKYNIKI